MNYLFKRNFSSTALKTKLFDGVLNGVYGIYLNSPQSRNSLSREIVSSLKEKINYIEENKQIRAVFMMSSSPGFFCSGANLKERKTMTEDEARSFVIDLRNTFQKYYSLRVPTICCIDGYALGGGLELALSHDLIIATKSSSIGLTETSLAIIPGAGGSQRLSRLIGSSKAKELIFTSEKIDGAEAKSLGIVNQLVENYEQLEPKALEICNKIIANGPIAIEVAKKAINEGINQSLEQGLEIEKKMYDIVINTEDRKEGIRAFLEKRKPSYKGK